MKKQDFYDNNLLNKNKLKENWIKKNHIVFYNNVIDFIIINNLLLEKFSQKIYHYLNNMIEIPKCEYCNNEYKRFMGFDIGYDKCCSKSCSSKYSSKVGQETRKEKTIEKYGVEHTSQLEKVKNKNKETCLINYGVDSFSKTNEFKNKSISTSLERYGVEHPMQLDNIKEKIKNTCLEKYGVTNSSKSEDVRNKMKANTLEKYGVEYIVQTKSVIEKSSKTRIEKRFNQLKLEYPNLNIIELPKEGIIKIHCDKCNNDYETNRSLFHLRMNRYHSEPCLYCNPVNEYRSSYEKELSEFLSKYIEIKINDRDIVNGYELDIYIPSLKIGIEINGLYWHSELEKDKNYHINKTLKCNENEITLIHIWEDEYLFKKDIIHSRLLNIINKTRNKIYARKCIIKVVDSKIEKDFLINNHIQGYVPSTDKIGLFYNNELVSLMTFSKTRKLLGQNNDNIELLRFCNKLNTNIIGGASKLFNYFINNYSYNKIISYAKRDWTNSPIDSLYDILGFKFEKYTDINYYWCKNLDRKHRYSYRKDKLIQEGYDKNKTEVEIMHSRGYYRIYDTGNLKFIF